MDHKNGPISRKLQEVLYEDEVVPLFQVEQSYLFHCGRDKECCGGSGSSWADAATILEAKIAVLRSIAR